MTPLSPGALSCLFYTWLILSMVLEAAVSSPCPGLTHTGLPVLNLLPVLESVFLCRSEPCPGVFLLL